MHAFRIVALLALTSTFGLVAAGNESLVTSGQTLMSVGIAAFLLAVMHGAPEARHFRSATLRWFGQISYALYLVHQPIAGLFHGILLGRSPDLGTGPQLLVTILAAATSVGVAAASWKWLEAPILSRARRHSLNEPQLMESVVLGG
jgi:peptidoglycan/LPS O-acetylase OafA/YrhL